jgi:hypothetical protein
MKQAAAAAAAAQQALLLQQQSQPPLFPVHHPHPGLLAAPQVGQFSVIPLFRLSGDGRGFCGIFD